MNINHCFLSSSGLFYYKIPLVLPLLWLSAWLLAPKGIFGRAKSLNLPVVQAGCWLAGERTKEIRLSRGRGDTYRAVLLCNIGPLASDSAYQMCPWLQSTVGIPTSGPQQANGLFLLSWKGSFSIPDLPLPVFYWLTFCWFHFKQSQKNNLNSNLLLQRKFCLNLSTNVFCLRLYLEYSKLIQSHCMCLYLFSRQFKNPKKEVLGVRASLTSFKSYLLHLSVIYDFWQVIYSLTFLVYAR